MIPRSQNGPKSYQFPAAALGHLHLTDQQPVEHDHPEQVAAPNAPRNVKPAIELGEFGDRVAAGVRKVIRR